MFEWMKRSLKVTTSNLKGGFLRRNGVPYSDNVSLMEYYELVTQPDGSPLLVVTISTTDPEYLRVPFVITTASDRIRPIEHGVQEERHHLEASPEAH